MHYYITMNTYYILSNDELNQIEVTGTDLHNAVSSAITSNMTAYQFFQEYKLEDCYVEEIKS